MLDTTPDPRRDPQRTRWPVVITAGLYGSGSTWVFNVVRRLLEELPAMTPVHTAFGDTLSQVSEPEQPPGSVVIKTHKPDRAMRLFAQATAAPVILTVRDPRDAIVSMMQRFGVSFAEMRDAVVASAHLSPHLALKRPRLVLRYEEGFTRDPAAVRRIAAFLGLAVPAGRMDAISAAMMADRVAADIEGLIQAGRFGATPDAAVADPVTQWHAGHIGDGRSDKWRALLSDAEAAALMAAVVPYCRVFQYV